MATSTSTQTQPPNPLEIAEAIAPGWERRREEIEATIADVRAWVLRELHAQPGQTLLELAAGAGDTGYDAAELIGPEGRLITTDFSPAMLDVARRRGAERGVENVTYRVMDAQRIDLEPGSVDGIICRFGLMLMADPAAALAGARRVLAPGGRLVFAVWAPVERNPFFAAFGRAMVAGGHIQPPPPDAPGQFALGDEARLRRLVEGAGFAHVRLEEVPTRHDIPGADEYLAVMSEVGGPPGLVLRRLSEDDRAAVRTRIEESLAPFATSDGYSVPGVALCGVAS